MLSDKAFLALTGAAAAVFTVLTTLAGWQWWVGLLVCVPVIAAGLLVKHRLEARDEARHEPPAEAPQPPPRPAAPATTRIQGIALPSKDRDYRFLLHCTVLWRRSPSASDGARHPRYDQLAIDAIRERATRHTQHESPGDLELLGPRLATALSYPSVDRGDELGVWAQDVVLTMPDADLLRLHRLAELRKDEQLWAHERLHERNVRAYLHDDVFTSTGRAVVWWLSRDPTKIEETVALIGALARLTAAANDREVDSVFRGLVDRPAAAFPETAPLTLSLNGGAVEPVRRLIDQTLPDGTEPDRAHMADQLATLVANLGADELAGEIRRAFNAPDFADDPYPPVVPVPDGVPTDLPRDLPHDPAGAPDPNAPVSPDDRPPAGPSGS